MASYSADVEGLAVILARLEQGDARVRRYVGIAMHSSLEHLRGKVAKYPPPPPQSTYRRTGTLGRKWAVKVKMAPDVVGYLGNNTPYAGYVQDRARQAWMHVGRWPTVQDVVDDEMEFVAGEFAEAARIIFEGD
jgi:hypothetical protein